MTSSVLLVEDHQLLAQSLSFALMAEGFSVEIAELDDARTITETVARLAPDVVMLDLDLGGSIGDGLELIQAVRELGARVLVVSGSPDRPRLARCLELGVAGVLPKSMRYEQLVQAVMDVAAGRPVMSEAERLTLLAELRAWRTAERRSAEPFDELTARERQVLGALMEGKSCEAIADGWFVSSATVRTQIRAVLTKLEVGTQLAAVTMAYKSGWSVPSAG
jgi:two-component system nitrate/nitrite response regulator NarL